MNIRPSAAIRQNYNEIADFCKKSGEPVFLTKNGEGDLVVMDITAFDRREKMLKLREELLAVEEDRLRGEAVIQLLYPNARRKCWYLTPLFWHR